MFTSKQLENERQWSYGQKGDLVSCCHSHEKTGWSWATATSMLLCMHNSPCACFCEQATLCRISDEVIASAQGLLNAKVTCHVAGTSSSLACMILAAGMSTQYVYCMGVPIENMVWQLAI